MDKRTAAAVGITIVFFIIWFQFVVPAVTSPAQPVAESETVTEGDTIPTQAAEAAEVGDPLRVDQTAEPAVAAADVQPREAEADEEAASAAPPGEPDEPAAVAVGAIPDEYMQENLEELEFTLDTEVLTVTFTTMTGSVKSVTLKDFQDFAREDELMLLTDFTEGRFPTEIEQCAGEDITGRLWKLALEPVIGEDGLTRVSFSTVLESGLEVTKTYVLYPERYGFGLKVEIANLADSPRSVSYRLQGPAGVPSEDLRKNDVQGVLATVPAEVGLEGKMDLDERAAARLMAFGKNKGRLTTTPARRVNFAGAINRYFVAVLRPSIDVPVEAAWCDAFYDSSLGIPELEGLSAEEARVKYPPEQLSSLANFFYSAGAGFEIETGEMAAAGGDGSRITHEYLMYCGPKDKKTLAAFDSETFSTGFPALMDYGMLEPLVKLILLLLRAFHSAIPNWGIAVIILTLVMRSAMHPLMRKSQLSMAKMQRLQPQIKKLQEKYKNDKQRLGQEQMKLMKEAGANPLGGCLPMLIQLPIFFALYRSLMLSIDLRHAPFMLWIDDLAQPDRLTQLPFVLPLLGTNFLNLLPILMVTSMMLQQKMMPKAATPEAAQQQKIMGLFMPVFIGFILYNLASGLNLYILTSTVFGITEQWWIRRHLAAQQG